MKSSIGHVPPQGQRWEFDREVTNVFDDMISRSIPQYGAMRALVTDLAMEFICAGGGRVLDLGCSTGLGISQLSNHASWILGIEVSEAMLEEAARRFQSYSNVEVRALDLCEDFPSENGFDVVLSIFTLQFIPVEHRARVVERAFEALRPGGAMIVAEKTLGASAVTQELYVRRYHRFKQEQGYTKEEVDRKASALRGSLVSYTDEGNVEALRRAGFRTVEPLWRWLNFGAWLAVKSV